MNKTKILNSAYIGFTSLNKLKDKKKIKKGIALNENALNIYRCPTPPKKKKVITKNNICAQRFIIEIKLIIFLVLKYLIIFLNFVSL